MYKCMTCDTFKIRIKAKKRGEETKFLIDPKTTCLEHIKYIYDENGVFQFKIFCEGVHTATTVRYYTNNSY